MSSSRNCEPLCLFATVSPSGFALTIVKTSFKRCSWLCSNTLSKAAHDADLRGWIFQVAHNLALKKSNGNRRRQQSQVLVWGDEPADQTPSAEEQLVWNERRLRLLSVFDALPDEDRYCLRLRAEGLSYREIAAVLDISIGSVSQYLTRSLARLARADGR